MLDFITQTLKALHDLFLLTLWCSIKDVRKKAVGMKCNSKANIPKDATMQTSGKRDVLLFSPQINVFCIGVMEGQEQGRKMERHQRLDSTHLSTQCTGLLQQVERKALNTPVHKNLHSSTTDTTQLASQPPPSDQDTAIELQRNRSLISEEERLEGFSVFLLY